MLGEIETRLHIAAGLGGQAQALECHERRRVALLSVATRKTAARFRKSDELRHRVRGLLHSCGLQRSCCRAQLLLGQHTRYPNLVAVLPRVSGLLQQHVV